MQVLEQKRLVEAHLMVQGLSLLRCRLLSQHGKREIARQQCRDQKCQKGDSDQNRDEIGETAPNKTWHIFYSLSQLSEISITSLYSFGTPFSLVLAMA